VTMLERLCPQKGRDFAFFVFVMAASVVLGFGGPGFPCERGKPQSSELVLLKKLVVPANAGWVDTGIDVEEGEELVFQGEGQISLQKGNPDAGCGPEGYDIQGLQQPLPDQNLGCLAGRVTWLLAVRTDEKTGEEVRDELIKYFYIGREQTVAMPLQGRLFLGVNENVVKDNDGEFTVSIYLKNLDRPDKRPFKPDSSSPGTVP